MPPLAVAVFAFTYAGMILGRLPGLKLDRTGIALLGTILLLAGGVVDARHIGAAIDAPTLMLLFALMIVSAQFDAAGFYGYAAARIAAGGGTPLRLLALTVLVAGGLSMVLANDIVVFAMTPLLVAGVQARGLDPRPYLAALAGAANAGSAATIIGNPQNILIGQAGRLAFLPFSAICAVPAGMGLLAVFAVTAWVWRDALRPRPLATPPQAVALPDSWQAAKAWAAVAVLVALFLSPWPREIAALGVAGILLTSRRLSSRDMLGAVDWPLLLLFACLFVVTDAFAATGLAGGGLAWMAAHGLSFGTLAVLAPLSLAASNTIGNVPAVMLLLSLWPHAPAGAMYGLAVLSTLSGNLLLVGSLANLIVAERALGAGVRWRFADHARAGIPMTLLSLALAAAWLLATGAMPWR